MRRIAVVLALAVAWSPAGAQTPFIVSTNSGAPAPPVMSGDGWEAFPNVEYQGGDATQAKKRWGMLVLTDSTFAFYACLIDGCLTHKKKSMIKDPPIWVIPVKSITEVSSSNRVRGASVTGKIAFGLLANDRTEEFFGFVYESTTSAEAPVFKTQKTQSTALEAKVKFRLKKLGITLAPPD